MAELVSYDSSPGGDLSQGYVTVKGPSTKIYFAADQDLLRRNAANEQCRLLGFRTK
jgi:hypothetical protein